MLIRTLLFTASLASASALAQPADDVELAQRIRALTDRSGADSHPVLAADGTVTVDLAGHFQHVYLAMQDAGELRAACVGSVVEANHFLGRNLETGARLPQSKAAPAGASLAAQASLHGMSEAEYLHYWNLIEQTKVQPNLPQTATFTIVNNDGAGEGFNDPTATAAEGGNNGATRGAQRLNVFNQAGSIWGAFLDSSVPISVRANFDPLTPCTSSGGVLGSAGPLNVHKDFVNAQFTGTYYPAALANKQRGSDLSAGTSEISATFNSSVDTGCLGVGTRFYYGFDNATPAGRINLLVVLLHELGHGVGSLSLTDETTGAYALGSPDIWARFQFDRTVNLTWLQMSNAQRAASAINVDNLLWDGPSVRIASGFLTVGRDNATGRVELFTPNPVQLGSSVSHWNARSSPNLLMEPAINTGLPLTLDLTRQQMRDIGWYRDTTGDLVRDTITGVLPSGGTLNVGANVTISWTNGGGFARNVSIELSTDGGGSYPISIASNIANTGSFSWTVPNSPTTTARVRVREADFAEPIGSSAANFTIASGNSAPSFTPAPALARQQGSTGGAAVTVGVVADGQTPAGSLTVTQISGGTATNVLVSGLTNSGGTVSAVVQASCTATAGTVRFQAFDGLLTGTGDLQVDVPANTPPTLTYANASVSLGAARTLVPATGLTDNGTISSVAVQSDGTYTGTISVNSSGAISLVNAGPIGTHTITIRATDNCSVLRDASFQLSVTSSDVYANGFE